MEHPELIPKLRDFRRTYIHLQQLEEQTQLREQTQHPERHATPPHRFGMPRRWDDGWAAAGFARRQVDQRVPADADR